MESRMPLLRQDQSYWGSSTDLTEHLDNKETLDAHIKKAVFLRLFKNIHPVIRKMVLFVDYNKK